MKKILVLLIFGFWMFNGHSQTSDFGNWLIYFGNKKLSNGWNIHNEVQHRNYNAIGDLEQLLLRTGIGKNLSPNNNNVLIGYGFIHSQNYSDIDDDKRLVNEHRLFQQYITFQRMERIQLQHRYRFEQRWVEGQDFRLRFRYFLSCNIALSNPGMVDKTWYASMYNEIFINNNNTLFDRNRLYGGLGYRVNDNLRFEIGYMNQFLGDNQRDQLNVITFFNF